MDSIKEKVIVKLQELNEEFGQLARVEKFLHLFDFLSLVLVLLYVHVLVKSRIYLLLILFQIESFEGVLVLNGLY